MDFLSAEPLLNGKPARRVTRNGRTWLVAPVAMIVDGVLHGSQGAGYYPPAETRKAAPLWDGMPITVNHPFDPITGAPLSAKDAGVLERQGIGTVFNPDWNGKLGAEGWFDEELTKNKAPKLLTALEKGEAFELSTGLFLNRVPVKGSFNGAPYDWEARDHKPDHLAVLIDQTGACSRAMGCGVNMNANPEGCNQYKACAASLSEHVTSEKIHDPTKFRAMYTELDDSEKVKVVKELASKGLVHPVDARKRKPMTASEIISSVQGQYGIAKTKHSDDPLNRHVPFSDSDVYKRFTSNEGGEPSEEIDPDKACEILHDGAVHGEPLTDAQRKMFGAACSEVSNAEPERKHTIWRWLGETLGVLNAATPNHPATGKFHPRATIAGEHAKKGAADGIPGDLPDPKVSAAAKEGFACECGKPDCDECKADNANPEGCNQHTGPGCGSGGGYEKGNEKHEETIKGLEAKGFHGTIDRFKRGKITHEQAAGELAGTHKPDVKVGVRVGPEHAAEHAAEMKRQGIGRQESWSRWIQRTSLNPGMDAKDWYKIYDSVANAFNKEETTMTRADTIKHLVANCECWKGGEAALNGLTDEQLKKLYEQNARMRTLELTGNALLTVARERGAPADLPIENVPDFVRNAFPPPKKGKKKDPDEEDEEEEMTDNKRKPYDEWMAAAPVEVQNFVTTAIEVTRQAQADLVAKLTANIADEAAKKAAQAAYGKMAFNDLKAVAAAMPGVQNAAPNLLPYFFGAQGGPHQTQRQTTNEEPDLLDVPTVNFAELAKERARERASA